MNTKQILNIILIKMNLRVFYCLLKKICFFSSVFVVRHMCMCSLFYKYCISHNFYIHSNIQTFNLHLSIIGMMMTQKGRYNKEAHLLVTAKKKNNVLFFNRNGCKVAKIANVLRHMAFTCVPDGLRMLSFLNYCIPWNVKWRSVLEVLV